MIKSRYTKKQADRWERIKARGRWNYVFFCGVLGFGILTAILVSASEVLLPYGQSSDQTFLGALKTALPTFMIAGFFWGLIMWSWGNKTHASYLETLKLVS